MKVNQNIIIINNVKNLSFFVIKKIIISCTYKFNYNSCNKLQLIANVTLRLRLMPCLSPVHLYHGTDPRDQVEAFRQKSLSYQSVADNTRKVLK